MRIALVLALLFLPYLAWSSEVFRGPVSSGLGGTGRAGISSAEGTLLNPAIIPLVKSYEFNMLFRDGYTDTNQHSRDWALSAADNSEGVIFPGAIHYARLRQTGRTSLPANGELWHLAGAYLFGDRLSLGASGYRLSWDLKEARDYVQWNGSLGMVYLINEDLAVAYVLDNLARPGSSVPRELRQDMRQAIGIFGRVAEIATLRLDVTREERFNPGKKMAYMAGFESATSEFFVIRLGYRRDELADQKMIAGGIGFNGPRLKFDYSVEKNVERTSGALHSVDLRIPF